jgi:hypothetical protein
LVEQAVRRQVARQEELEVEERPEVHQEELAAVQRVVRPGVLQAVRLEALQEEQPEVQVVRQEVLLEVREVQGAPVAVLQEELLAVPQGALQVVRPEALREEPQVVQEEQGELVVVLAVAQPGESVAVPGVVRQGVQQEVPEEAQPEGCLAEQVAERREVPEAVPVVAQPGEPVEVRVVVRQEVSAAVQEEVRRVPPGVRQECSTDPASPSHQRSY